MSGVRNPPVRTLADRLVAPPLRVLVERITVDDPSGRRRLVKLLADLLDTPSAPEQRQEP